MQRPASPAIGLTACVGKHAIGLVALFDHLVDQAELFGLLGCHEVITIQGLFDDLVGFLVCLTYTSFRRRFILMMSSAWRSISLAWPEKPPEG